MSFVKQNFKVGYLNDCSAYYIKTASTLNDIQNKVLNLPYSFNIV